MECSPLGLVVWSRLDDPFISQNPILFSWTDSVLNIYHLLVWSNLNFLYNSQWITFFAESCLVLHSFFDNLLHSLIIRFVVSSLSLHNQTLLYLVCYCFDIVSPYGVVLCCYQKRFRLFLKASLCSSCPSFVVWDLAWKVRYSCFSSIDVCLVCIVSRVCHKLCFSCIDASTFAWMMVIPLPPSFLGTKRLIYLSCGM